MASITNTSTVATASGGSMTHTFGFTGTAGRVLCVIATSGYDDSLTESVTGWTKAITYPTTGSPRMHAWWKVSDGTETQFFLDWAAGYLSATAQCVEIGGFTGTPELDVQSSGSSGAGSESVSTGTTSTSANDDVFALAFLGSSNYAEYTGVSVDGGFTLGTWSANISHAWNYSASATSFGTTFSQQGTGNWNAAIASVITFSVPSSGAGDTLLGGTFNTTGLTLDASSAVSDNPLGGSVEVSGLTLSALSAIDDTPNAGSFEVSGLTMAASSAIDDTPLGGSFEVSGATIDGSASIIGSDTLLGGSLNISGLTIAATSNISDTLLGGSFDVTGATIDGSASTGVSDTLLGGSFSVTGATISAASAISDSPNGGSFEIAGLTLNGFVGYADTLLGGSFESYGSTLSAVSAIVDSPVGGDFNITGLLLSAYPGVEDEDITWREPERIEMRQIPYGSDAVPLSFSVPLSWDVTQLTAVSVSIADRAGNEALASSECTLWPSTTIDGDIEQFDDQFVLAAGSTSPISGDVLTLLGSDDFERVTVKKYDATTLTVTTESVIDSAYSDGDSVYGNFVSYELDVSDTDTWTAGKSFVATWTPVGTGIPFRTVLQVSKFSADTADIEQELKDLYPRVYFSYKNPVDRMARMISIAQRRIENDLKYNLMDYNRIVGEPILKDLLLAQMACLWAKGGDNDLSDERTVLNDEYSALLATLKNSPVWTDTDQDGIVDETVGEVSSHGNVFFRSW